MRDQVSERRKREDGAMLTVVKYGRRAKVELDGRREQERAVEVWHLTC